MNFLQHFDFVLTRSIGPYFKTLQGPIGPRVSGELSTKLEFLTTCRLVG